MALETVLLGLWSGFVGSLPGIIAAIIVLLIGLVIGKVVGKLVKEVLGKLKVDEYVLEGEKLAFKFSDVFSVVARWWIYLVFIQQAAVFLGVNVLTQTISSIVSFLPKMIESALIVIAGYMLAEYIKDKIISKKTFYASVVGKVIFFLFVYMAIALALPIMDIDSTIVNYVLLVIVGSVGVGMAIAMGLGLKDAVAQSAKEYMAKGKRKR